MQTAKKTKEVEARLGATLRGVTQHEMVHCSVHCLHVSSLEVAQSVAIALPHLHLTSHRQVLQQHPISHMHKAPCLVTMVMIKRAVIKGRSEQCSAPT